MTPISLLLAALGLVLTPRRSPAAGRLTWLAARRWHDGVPSDGVSKRPRSRPWSGAAGRPLLVAPAFGLPTGILAGPGPGALALLTGVVAARCWQRISVERARSAELTELAATVSALVAELAAGATLAAALVNAASAAGRHRDALERAGRLATLGREPAAAMADQPALARIAVAIALVNRSGSAAGEVFQRLRADLLGAQRADTAVAEAVAGARTSALLLAGLPAVGLAMGTALGARPLRVLLHTAPGLGALAVGVLLNLSGVLWTLRVTAPDPAVARDRVGRSRGG